MSGRHHVATGRRAISVRAATTGVARSAGLLVVVLLSALGIAILIVLGVGIAGGPGTAQQPIAQPPGPAAEQAGQQAADPVRVRVPSIGVDAPVGPLVVDENGVLPPPDTFTGTGWWQEGPEPGEIGPAVIAGHVDSYSGPAVFFRLDELDSGDEIFVDRADGTTVVFEAQRTERHEKDDFPTDTVYGDTADPRLRLITCGGDFDEGDRRYLDNVIVYADLVA